MEDEALADAYAAYYGILPDRVRIETREIDDQVFTHEIRVHTTDNVNPELRVACEDIPIGIKTTRKILAEKISLRVQALKTALKELNTDPTEESNMPTFPLRRIVDKAVAAYDVPERAISFFIPTRLADSDPWELTMSVGVHRSSVRVVHSLISRVFEALLLEVEVALRTEEQKCTGRLSRLKDAAKK